MKKHAYIKGVLMHNGITQQELECVDIINGTTDGTVYFDECDGTYVYASMDTTNPVPVNNDFVTFTFNVETEGDDISFAVNSYDDSDIIFDWGDGTSDIVTSNEGVNHAYAQPGIYYATMSNSVSYLQMWDVSNMYTTMGNEFRNATHLTQLSMMTYLTDIVEGALDNCPLVNIGFKYNNITSITKGMFSNIPTLNSIWWGENQIIMSIEPGSFELPNLSTLYFYVDFSDGTLVDTILTDLNNVLAHNGNMYSYTCRTSASDSAYEALTIRSFIVDCD